MISESPLGSFFPCPEEQYLFRAKVVHGLTDLFVSKESNSLHFVPLSLSILVPAGPVSTGIISSPFLASNEMGRSMVQTHIISLCKSHGPHPWGSLRRVFTDFLQHGQAEHFLHLYVPVLSP